jgi:hypothetical protein
LNANLLYIKIQKTGSSTFGGVMRRIAAKHGISGVDQAYHCNDNKNEPILCANHGQSPTVTDQFYSYPRKLPVARLSMVRDPVQRALSAYYHLEVTRKAAKADDADIIKYLDQVEGDFEVKYLGLDGTNLTEDILLHDYTLVGTTERMNESVLVLKYVLGLPSICDLFFVNSKVSSSGGVDDLGFEFVEDVPLERQSTEVQAFARSPEFVQKMEPDMTLHASANNALDSLIDGIGREAFGRELRRFERLLDEAANKCSDEKDMKECYWNDNGCAYKCLDSVCDNISS